MGIQGQGPAMLNQQKVFADRLARISAHAGNTNATLHIGLDDQLPQAALVRAAALPTVRLVPAFGLLKMPLALVTGAAAWAWVQWMRVTVFETVDPMMALGIDLGGTLVALLLLRLAFGLTGFATLLMQLVGVAVAFAGLHNAVHLWPEQFGLLFPPHWVNAVLESTQPMTLAMGTIAI